MDIVENAIRTRVYAMSGNQALQTINAHAQLLGNWIESSEVLFAAPFVLGTLMGITMFAGAKDMEGYIN